MSAHSRTPWTLRIEYAKTTDPRFTELGEYLSRAEILSGETLLAASHIRPLERPEAQIVADIRLMHAAPDLLKALKDLLDHTCGTDSFCEWCERHAPKDRDGAIKGPIPHVSDCLRLAAERAIAKAEGI